jgi:hypothetical protein
MKEWQSCWDDFVRYVTTLHAQRKSDVDIARAVAGCVVEWVGVVVRLNLESQHLPGVQLAMKYSGRLPNGIRIKADHLYASVPQKYVSTWVNASLNHEIRFRGRIIGFGERGPLLPVRLAEVSEEDYIALEVSIVDGELIASSDPIVRNCTVDGI